MKLQIQDISPPFVGLIIGMPVYVLMNMANLYFQPDEVLRQIEASIAQYSTVFLAGKILALFFSVFVAAGIAFLIRKVKTPWTFRIMAGSTIVLSLVESFTHQFPFWYIAVAILSCVLATAVSREFVYKF